MGLDYLGSLTSTTQPQFGDEQPFPGSIRLLRGIDIEELNFLVNLPSTQFTTTQNPTYVLQSTSGYPKITEVALLDSNKETLVVAKATTPITRLGTQVFAVKLDF
jgi:alpha-D-ribose 1-methylphosphonate 5-triphosphate synthase subunit PhnI